MKPVTDTVTCRPIDSYPPFWAAKLLPVPFLPMTSEEMDENGWDRCDIILVTGDAYIDHPSFGMAIIGRVLEGQGFRVGIIAQPGWRSTQDFMRLGKPGLFFGITSGNMDSMINRYTADRRIRSDDAYSPDNEPDRRPDRSVIVYSQRCREAYPDVPIIIGGIEASLRRLTHYDYWSDTIRRSILLDSKADLLVYGNAERPLIEIAHNLAGGKSLDSLHNIPGTAFSAKEFPIGRQTIVVPSFEQIKTKPSLLTETTRVIRSEMNPWTGNILIQPSGDRQIIVNPPPLPLSTQELDWIYELPYQRLPHPAYHLKKIPAFEMIRFSVTIMRGCFGGCSFCSITEHEGRFIQSRSEESIIREIEHIRDTVEGFTGFISDIGGPTANMYRMGCKRNPPGCKCDRISCLFPSMCPSLNTDHEPLIRLYRKAREIPGVKKILISSGIRHDLALQSPKYIRELAQHHVGGYLKVAPEHTDPQVLNLMFKPSIDSFVKFNRFFDRFSKDAGLEQYLIPYFISAFPGSSLESMVHLALWLKSNRYRIDQVQSFIPLPMTPAAAAYAGGTMLSEVHPDKKMAVRVPSGLKERRDQKALLRYHDPANWPAIRRLLQAIGRRDLIGPGRHHLVPAYQPTGKITESKRNQRKKKSHFSGPRT